MFLEERMVMSTHGGGSSSGSGLGAGTEAINERMREYISSEITHNILEQTPVIFSTIKDGITNIFDKPMGVFRT